ncbi:hypothetical protein [Streptomyces sp. NPDC056817]|uniref:hypothetical protein n=1 Tax=Streptomyces sp. NPDC056817 TaxID=3345950 RepID=UPI00369E7335
MATPDPTAVKAAAADARTALAALITAADAYGQASTPAGQIGLTGPTTPQVVASVVLDVLDQARHTSPAGDQPVRHGLEFSRQNAARLAHPVVTP